MSVDCLAFSPDGKTIAACPFHVSEDSGVVLLWEAGTGRLVRSFLQNGFEFHAVTFNDTGRSLIVGAKPSTPSSNKSEWQRERWRQGEPAPSEVISIGVESGLLVRVLFGHGGRMDQIGFSGNDPGCVTVIGENSSVVTVWELGLQRQEPQQE